MDDGDLSSLIILLLLVGVYGLITLMYTAITNVRQAHLRELADSGQKRAQQIIRILDNLAYFNITHQIALLIVAVVTSAFGTVTIAQSLVASYPAVAPVLIYAATLSVILLALLLFGNLAPSAIGTAYADRLALALGGPARLLTAILWPLVSVIMAISRVFAGALGGDDLAVTVTEEEIMTLVNAGQKEGTIEDEEKAMIFSVLQFSETLVREVMIPRMDIEALEINTPLEVALGKFVETGHSRIPVYDEKIDNIEGLLYAKDLLTLWHNGGPKPTALRELMRPVYFVPEDKRADLVLKEMQNSKIHLAVIVDEYGGTAGIVTIENLIEEIVGDIQDEYDPDEEEEYIQAGENEYVIDASMDLHDVNELLNISLPTEENDTLGGYIYGELGRVPTVGEVVDDPEHALILRVDSVDGRRIRKVHVTRVVADDGNGLSDEQPETIDENVQQFSDDKAG